MKNKLLWIGMGAVVVVLGAGCSSTPEDDTPGALGGAGGSVGPAAGSAGVAMMSGGSGGSGTAGSVAGGGGSTVAGTGAAGTTMAGAGAGAGTGGATAGSGGTTDVDGSMPMADAGPMGAGDCCPTGDCLCHGEPPSAVTSSDGPFATDSYDLASAGCIFYPTDADPPFAAVTISDGFGGSGGCGFSQTGEWGPLYASWGIVAMIIHTGAGDQPQQRGTKLSAGIEAFKAENMKSDSPLFGKLSGRYGTSGFSMGGGGTTFSAQDDPTLRTNVSIMAWTPSTTGIMVPSLYIFGSADTLAGTMGMASYDSIADSVPKMAVTIASSHAGQPSSGGGASGEAGLAFQKVYLEGDERWRPLLLSIDATETNIQ